MLLGGLCGFVWCLSPETRVVVLGDEDLRGGACPSPRPIVVPDVHGTDVAGVGHRTVCGSPPQKYHFPLSHSILWLPVMGSGHTPGGLSSTSRRGASTCDPDFQ